MLSYEGPAIQQVSNVPQEGGKVTIRGHGFGTSPSSITVLLNGVQCGNIEVTHPHSEITCTVPPPSKYTNQATLTLTVADQQASSTVYYGMWDTASCGKLLFIPTDDPFTVYKPQTSPKQLAQSTVTSTTQLLGGNCVYEWHLSISGLKDYGACKGCYWVAYGLISKPQLDHSNPSPCSSMPQEALRK
ncbi:hypothetical protein Pelo_19281 [Pelomyxa schiedti]|nr:hypothetical protein Pelo_19281 [Pelomyxa schiedti]